jgi:hypothetical protein
MNHIPAWARILLENAALGVPFKSLFAHFHDSSIDLLLRRSWSAGGARQGRGARSGIRSATVQSFWPVASISLVRASCRRSALAPEAGVKRKLAREQREVFESCGLRVVSTLPPKTIKTPFSITCRRLALINPSLGSFSSTGLSETMLPFAVLTVASDRDVS